MALIKIPHDIQGGILIDYGCSHNMGFGWSNIVFWELLDSTGFLQVKAMSIIHEDLCPKFMGSLEQTCESSIHCYVYNV